MTNTAPTRSLVIEREMPHPAEKIWRALTQGPLIAEWLMKNDFEPKMGHKFSFRSEPVKGWDGVIDAEVLLLEPHSRLSYSWATMGMASTVTWTLTPTQGGTHLRMEQTGFRSEQDAAYKGASYGWNMFIGKMEQVIGGLQ
ncbi:MAG: SRPBCC domain-containing protein [Candidatus Acidiferrales bacterium]